MYVVNSCSHLSTLTQTDTFSSIVGFVSSFDFLPREESGTLVQLGEVEDSETARRM